MKDTYWNKKHVPAWVTGLIGLVMVVIGYGGFISLGGIFLIAMAVIQRSHERRNGKEAQ